MNALDGVETPFPASVQPIVRVEDSILDHYVLDSDVVVEDDIRPVKTWQVDGTIPTPQEGHYLTLTLGMRAYVERDTVVRLCLPLGEPEFTRTQAAVRVRRVRRDVVVEGDLRPLWALFRLLDGQRAVADVLTILDAAQRPVAARLLAQLVSAGAVDHSPCSIRRFVHGMTKKGSLPARGLDLTMVLRLVTDGQYRRYPHAQRMAMSTQIPPLLQPVQEVIASRRSYRDYNGEAISRAQFDALMFTACGVTGQLAWQGRNVPLRGYPSSGGLYSIEIYPVVFRVEGLDSGLYHYCPTTHELERLDGAATCSAVVDTALPSERQMLRNVAVMVCLTAVFQRHESKYGEGGYRMMVAEAGHISQNLLLAAAALELDGRPFGGVFDDMLNQALSIERGAEEFLLSVLIGHAG